MFSNWVLRIQVLAHEGEISLKIFISWSKNKSREIALEVKDFFEGLFHNSIELWMSSDSIEYGSTFIIDINDALRKSDCCIAIITEENINSSWIMYEIGAIAGKSYFSSDNLDTKAVIPIIFDGIDDKKFSNSPINQFQRLRFGKESIFNLSKQLNKRVGIYSSETSLEKQFNLNWNGLLKGVERVANKYSIKGNIPVTCKFLSEAFNDSDFPYPINGRVLKYESGFETQKLYDILLSNASKRLWFFGRKNRKLFSTENRDFFADLNRRMKNGFDFKCLFLNPNIKELVEHAQKGKNFNQKLAICIQEAFDVLKANNIDLDAVCRFYSCDRSEHIIVIDNAVIYSNINYGDDNLPLPLTKAQFYMLDAEDPIAQKCIDSFMYVWKVSDKPNIILSLPY